MDFYCAPYTRRFPVGGTRNTLSSSSTSTQQTRTQENSHLYVRTICSPWLYVCRAESFLFSARTHIKFKVVLFFFRLFSSSSSHLPFWFLCFLPCGSERRARKPNHMLCVWCSCGYVRYDMPPIRPPTSPHTHTQASVLITNLPVAVKQPVSQSASHSHVPYIKMYNLLLLLAMRVCRVVRNIIF